MIWMTQKEDGGWLALILTGDALDLEALPRRLRGVLENPDFSARVVQRLFPQAYRDDEESEREYRGLLGQDLLHNKLSCLEAFERSIRDAHRLPSDSGVEFLQVELSNEDLGLWLGFLHDLRLVIGTALDITDDNWNESICPDDPDFEEYLLMEQLAHIEQTILEALREVDGLR